MICPAENLQTSALCRKLIQKDGLVAATTRLGEKQVTSGTERISLEELRKVLKLESYKMQQERSSGLLARVRKIACADES
jgi:hypothetical protein